MNLIIWYSVSSITVQYHSEIPPKWYNTESLLYIYERYQGFKYLATAWYGNTVSAKLSLHGTIVLSAIMKRKSFHTSHWTWVQHIGEPGCGSEHEHPWQGYRPGVVMWDSATASPPSHHLLLSQWCGTECLGSVPQSPVEKNKCTISCYRKIFTVHYFSPHNNAYSNLIYWLLCSFYMHPWNLK